MTGSYTVHTDARTSVDRASQGIREAQLEEGTWRMGRARAERLDSRDINESKGVIPDVWNGLQWSQMFPH